MFTHTTLIQPKKINQLYEAKALDDIPVCPRECLVILSNTTGLTFAKERIGPLAAFIIMSFIYSYFVYLLYRKPLKICLLSICREFLIHTTSQHLLLLIGFDTLTYRKYCDTPPILVGHHVPILPKYYT